MEKKKKVLFADKTTNICLLLLLAGTILKLVYAGQIVYNRSTHDLGNLSDWTTATNGHLGYIQYLYQYGKLPDVSPEINGQCYHPPLFYAVGALILKIFYRMGEDVGKTFEIVQYVNMLFACVATYYGYRILKKLQIKENILILLTAFLAFCPSFYIIGSEINNDCMMTMFCIAAVYYTLCWSQDMRFTTIIKIAVCIVCGMLSKTSAVLIAPAIATVFLYVLIQNRKDFKKLLVQYVVFGVTSIPLGLSFLIRNKVLYNTDFNFVPVPPVPSQNVSAYSFFQRIGFPKFEQLTNNTIIWDAPEKYYNIWGQTAVTMIYDEGLLFLRSEVISFLGIVLTCSGVLITLGALYAMIKLCFIKTFPMVQKLLFVVGYFTLIGSYISFCFQYPFICTMNFRYIVTTLIFLLGSYGCYCMHQDKEKKIEKAFSKVMNVLIITFCVLTSELYLFCAV